MVVKAIKFYADWCGPCRSYTPIWEKVSKEIGDKVELLNVNIDKDTTGLAAEYKIMSVPTTVFINENGDATKEVGLLNEQKLKELILF